MTHHAVPGGSRIARHARRYPPCSTFFANDALAPFYRAFLELWQAEEPQSHAQEARR